MRSSQRFSHFQTSTAVSHPSTLQHHSVPSPMTVDYRYTPVYTAPSSSPTSTTTTMPARARSVSFEAQPVYSRQPYDDETHVMKTFSRHAGRCEQCKNPYQVHLKGETLCTKGHQRALDVAQYVYTREGQAYSVVDREGHQRVQIEIPAGCEPVRLLLRAMERGLRLMRSAEGAAAAPVSCDRTYYVAPRRTSSDKKPASKPVQRERAATTTEKSSRSHKKSHRHHSSESSTSSTSSAEPKPRRAHSHKHRDEHTQAWPRGGAVYYAPRQSVYEPRAAPADGYSNGYYSFPAYQPPRSGLISVW